MSRLFHRKEKLVTDENVNVIPAGSRVVKVLKRGAVVDGSQTGVSSITVHPDHGFEASDDAIVGSDEAKFFTVAASGVKDTVIPLLSGTIDVTDGDVIVNLGDDSGSVGNVTYDDNSVVMYDTVDTTTAKDPSEVTSNATSGEYEYWSTSEVVWEVVMNSDGDAIDTIVQDVQLDYHRPFGIQTAKATLSDLSADATADSLIPAGSIVLGITARVITAMTSGTGTTWSVGVPSATGRYGDSASFAVDTTLNLTDITTATPSITPLYVYSAATDVVVVTNDASAFTAGAVELTVHYITLS